MPSVRDFRTQASWNLQVQHAQSSAMGVEMPKLVYGEITSHTVCNQNHALRSSRRATRPRRPGIAQVIQTSRCHSFNKLAKPVEPVLDAFSGMCRNVDNRDILTYGVHVFDEGVAVEGYVRQQVDLVEE
jgi:hypothetical protein